jgi:hypothetical protein
LIRQHSITLTGQTVLRFSRGIFAEGSFFEFSSISEEQFFGGFVLFPLIADSNSKNIRVIHRLSKTKVNA